MAVEAPLQGALLPGNGCHHVPACGHPADPAPAPGDLQEISLLVELSGGSPASPEGQRVDTLQVLGFHTIESIKLRLKMKGWFTSRHALVCPISPHCHALGYKIALRGSRLNRRGKMVEKAARASCMC